MISWLHRKKEPKITSREEYELSKYYRNGSKPSGVLTIENDIMNTTKPGDSSKHCESTGWGSIHCHVHGKWGDTLILDRCEKDGRIGFTFTVWLEESKEPNSDS